MRKLTVAEHISLDGVIQAPGGPEEDPSGGFNFGGWTVPFGTDEDTKDVLELHARPFELLLGRRTYDIWASYWPNVPAGNPIADPFNETVKHVATHRPESLTWQNSRPLDGNPAEAVRTLKNLSGPDLLTWGSSELVKLLLAKGLVDELWLMAYPVLLGKGKRLFDETSRPASFRLESSTRYNSGAMLNRFILAGDVQTGSFV